MQIIKSNYNHENKPVYYNAQTKSGDKVSSIESWIKDYISDTGSEIQGLTCGELNKKSTSWVFTRPNGIDIEIDNLDHILIPITEGWLYTRLGDLNSNITSISCKLNTIQFWYG